MLIKDPTRLLLLCILRSAAAMKHASVSVRLARKGDIPSITKCNLESLPENYTPQFYDMHLMNWPQLALVAEHTPPSQGDPKVVGYVLGRVDSPQPASWSMSGMPRESSGHVTSLAVSDEFRRRGIADALMLTLHEKMRLHHRAACSKLHVRKSNTGAIKLYRDVMGYRLESVVHGYYEDGEDAYLMKCDLRQARVGESARMREREERLAEQAFSPVHGGVGVPTTVPAGVAVVAGAGAGAGAGAAKASRSGWWGWQRRGKMSQSSPCHDCHRSCPHWGVLSGALPWCGMLAAFIDSLSLLCRPRPSCSTKCA
ncbi:unnamed protein product [Chrysoparadoxa australica]